MTTGRVESVAVIGGGPAGLATLHSLLSEKSFKKIQLFERKEQAGGLWVYDEIPEELTLVDEKENTRDIEIPNNLPKKYPTQGFPKGFKSAAYEYLETNVPDPLMSFSYSRIKEQRTDHSIKLFGPDHPFRHITIVRDFIQKEFKQYENLVKYNTSVELIAKRATKWVVTLREFNRDKDNQDYWYQESYDAVIVANGHYSIPNIPNLLGLCEAQKVNRGLIQHTNSFRNIDDYINKRILVVGTGISSIDLVSDILPVVKSPLFVSSRGEKPRNDFNDSFKINENLKIKPEITRIDVSENKEKLIVYFEDGTSLEEIDKLILATGYVYDYPFFKDNEIIVNSNNRVENLFQHIFKIGDPTLSFVGIVIASITFRIFEYQSTLIARVLADRSSLPSLEKQKQWELELLCKKGNSPAFHVIPPDFQTYYEDLIRLAGKGNGIGHQLQPFEESWLEILDRAKKLKLKYWSRNNVSSHDRLDSNSEATL